MSTPFTAKTPGDLVALAPVILGFVPSESLVMMTFGGVQNFHGRVDVSADPLVQLEHAALLLNPAKAHESKQVAFLVFTSDELTYDFYRALLPGVFEDAGIGVVEFMLVTPTGGHQFDWTGDHASGRVDLDTHPLTCEAVLKGFVSLDSREDLVATLAPSGDGDDRTHVARATADWLGFERTREERATQARWLRSTLLNEDIHMVGPETAGRMLALLLDKDVRDVAISGISRTTAKHVVDVVRDLVRRSEGEAREVAAAVVAFAAWQAGDGALARAAVDEAGDQILAALVKQALVSAADPNLWTPMTDEELPLLAS